MNHQADERRIKDTSSGKDVAWQSSTWNVTLAALIRSFASASITRRNVTGNHAVRLTYQYLSVETGAAAKLSQLAQSTFHGT
jgi:hypothetical protein